MSTKKNKVKTQIVKEIHQYARKNFERRKYNMRGIADTLQADLIEMQNFKRTNRGYRYILIAIDVFSKMAYAEPVKNKTAQMVSQAMETIFNRVGRPIRNLHTDDGTEFFNGTMRRLLVRYGDINHYSTYTVKKASIVERLIRTIKRKLYMYFTYNRTHRWYNILQTTIDAYNNRR